MKKIIILTSTIITLMLFSLNIMAVENNTNIDGVDQVIESETSAKDNSDAWESSENVENSVEAEKTENTEEKEMEEASEEILGAMTKKDKKIAELTDKYNDKTLGVVAYVLEMARYYSTPIFFIFLTIGAFNFFIVGNKKLDKKEQGFGWITGCMIGWVFFQCIPLIFALFAMRGV